MPPVYTSLFRLGDARPPGTWKGAHGVVVLAEDGHLLGAKAAVADRAWSTVNTRLTDLASRVNPAHRPTYAEDVWPITSPVERFILATLLTDGRAHRSRTLLEHDTAGSVLGIYSNKRWSKHRVQERLTGALGHAIEGDFTDSRLTVSDILDLPRRP